jgi:thiol-disulfide isomerase/thioredoxin
MNPTGIPRIMCVIAAVLCAALFCGCASNSGADSTAPGASADVPTGVSAFELPTPADESAREYLGIAESDTFKVTDIQADVLIIEVFNMYCPHCQKEAPNVNLLYDALLKDPDLNKRIKLIGVGVGNTRYEVNLFREKYGVSFPIFPDQDMSIGRTLGVRGTPTFIGIELKPDGTYRDFYFKSGKMGEIDVFIDKMSSMSPPEKE